MVTRDELRIALANGGLLRLDDFGCTERELDDLMRSADVSFIGF